MSPPSSMGWRPTSFWLLTTPNSTITRSRPSTTRGVHDAGGSYQLLGGSQCADDGADQPPITPPVRHRRLRRGGVAPQRGRRVRVPYAPPRHQEREDASCPGGSGKRRTLGETSKAMTPARPPLVLLVDDDADSRELYAIGLQPFEFEIADVDSADAALLFIQDAPRGPDVVVTDLTMPGLPTVDLIQILRSDPRTQAIRIIVLTGMTGGQRLEAVRTAGCHRVVTKPCLAEELARHIQSV